MSVDSYKEAFEAARLELQHLLEQQEEIDRRISQLKQSIVALAPLAKEESLAAQLAREWMGQLGITNAIREALKSDSKPFTALEVKDRLIKTGANLSGYKNPLAGIHAVLKRLVESGEADPGTDSEGNATYVWVRQPLLGRLYEVSVETPSRAVRASGAEGGNTMPPVVPPDIYRSGMRGNEQPKKKS